MRMQAGTNKSQAKLQALQNLRNQVLQIEAENRQFQRGIDQMRVQAQIQLEANARQLSGVSGNVQTSTNTAIRNIGVPQPTNLVAQSAQAAPTMLTGQITPRRLSELELGLPYTALPSAGLTSRMI